jgi:peptidyl-prolyl cis-trans isomerase D
VAVAAPGAPSYIEPQASPAGTPRQPIERFDVKAQELLRSWTSRLVLLVLIIAFAAWGVSDMLASRGSAGKDDVALVGEEGISLKQLDDEYRRDLTRAQSRRPDLTPEEALRQGLYLQSLIRLVGTSLVRQEAATLGVAVNDDSVRERVMAQPGFRNQDGAFDRDVYEKTLRSNNLTPERYEALIRDELGSQQVLDAVAAPRPAPAAFATALYQVRAERRSARAAIVARDDALAVAEPDQATLEAFQQERAAQFTAPQYRTVTLLRLTPEALISTIELSDDDLKAEYDSRVAEFKLSETRTIEQLQSPDEAMVKEGAAALAAGQSFDAVTTALKEKGATMNVLNGIARSSLPADIAEVVFTLPKEGVSAPLKTAFGFGLYRVTEIVAEHTRSFDEVKDEIRREMALRLAADSVVTLATTIEDELAGGADITQAAKAVGADSLVLTLDAAGLDKAAAEVLPGAPDREEIIASVFQLGTVGEDTGKKESKGQTIYVARLDGIEEATLRPFAEVRDQVLAAWQLSQRIDQARSKAEALAARIKGGAKLDEEAAALGYVIVALDDLARDQREAPRGITAAALRALFEQPIDAPTPIVAPTAEGFAVVMLTGHSLADPEVAKDDIAGLADSLGRMRANDLELAYKAALERRYGVSINQTKLAELFPARN